MKKSLHSPSVSSLSRLWSITLIFGLAISLPVISNAQPEPEPCFDENYTQNPFGIAELLNKSTLVQLVDIDHDNTLEAFISIEGTDPNLVHYYDNSGSDALPAFVFQEDDPFGLHQGGKLPWQFVDIDGDGLHEVFLTGYFTIDDIPIRMVDNTGTETEPNFESAPIPDPYGITLPESSVTFDKLDAVFPYFVDIDNDGDYDVFITGWFHNGLADEALFFMENKDTTAGHTAPTFDSLQINPFGFNLPLTEEVRWTIFADMDCDGDFDMYMTTIPGNDLYYFENKGTPEMPDLSEWFHSSIPDPFSPPGGGFIDIGGDGDLDLINSGYKKGVQYYNYIGKDCDCIEGLKEQDVDANITLSPNPAQDMLQLTIDSEIPLKNTSLEIFDPMGNKVYTDNLATWTGATSKTIDISQLPPGFYFLKIDLGEEVWAQKFVKME
ncbi:MAG: T9SS type A sorting domain-containing protein [Lewinellaceae bacterium]|nr:T9SS type A sorting domain-containing protein [Lewinellaceae bacterium]